MSPPGPVSSHSFFPPFLSLAFLKGPPPVRGLLGDDPFACPNPPRVFDTFPKWINIPFFACSPPFALAPPPPFLGKTLGFFFRWPFFSLSSRGPEPPSHCFSLHSHPPYWSLEGPRSPSHRPLFHLFFGAVFPPLLTSPQSPPGDLFIAGSTTAISLPFFPLETLLRSLCTPPFLRLICPPGNCFSTVFGYRVTCPPFPSQRCRQKDLPLPNFAAVKSPKPFLCPILFTATVP